MATDGYSSCSNYSYKLLEELTLKLSSMIFYLKYHNNNGYWCDCIK